MSNLKGLVHQRLFGDVGKVNIYRKYKKEKVDIIKFLNAVGCTYSAFTDMFYILQICPVLYLDFQDLLLMLNTVHPVQFNLYIVEQGIYTNE